MLRRYHWGPRDDDRYRFRIAVTASWIPHVGQSSPRSSHRTTVQRIFRYLKHTPEFKIWYSASSLVDLVGFSIADFVGCCIDRKNTYDTCHFLRSSLVCWSSKK
jgi:hypothetical protein